MISSRISGILNVLLFCSLFTLGGCSSVYVSSDFDPAVDRSRYVSYLWSSKEDYADTAGVSAHNPFIYKRVRNAVDRELAARGYELKKSGPVDFVVGVQIRKALKSALFQDPFYYPRGFYRGRFRGQLFMYDPWWGGWDSPAYVRFYEEGLLVVDITDGRSNKPVWRGSAWGALRDHPKMEAVQSDVDRTVSKIIERFSPLKKGK
ncbi:MAG: DUF4136 domain-containing protein [Chlorobiaceae bacterium]|nr:DUF4136 domain-containing protein [Chlorobiaceae bacterium]NTV17606.1 DUF4136 domain-containing protein [Chlorobiaceae bacterium]